MRFDLRSLARRGRAGIAGVALLAVAGCGATAPQGRGVILFVGDGMGIASLTAARFHRGATAGISPLSEATLHMDEAPRSCLVRTASLDALVTDSAASMTSMVTGVKVASGLLSVDVGASGTVRSLTTLLEEAEARGLSTGIVTTTTITHATPAALYAHVADRRAEEEIATALVPGTGNPALGDGVEVLLGGGRAFFVSADGGGVRQDGRDLVAELRAAGYRYATSGDELRRAVDEKADRILGLFADSHMAFEVDRAAAPTEPSLAEMTAHAIDVLRRNPRGYFLMVEGGRIDHAHHANNGRRAIVDVLAFDDAVAAALDRTTAAEAIFVTADHDHTMVIAGYPAAADGVFSAAGVDVSGAPYTTILYANGPAAMLPVPAQLTAETLADPDFRERAGVPLEGETHGGMDVPLFIFGPEELYRDLPASIDNTEIFARVLRAFDTEEP